MSSYHPFNFNLATVKPEALLRQRELCAACGKVLIPEMMEEAHHVVPKQSGNTADRSHSWIRTSINCVMLCKECHTEDAHLDGNFKTGPVALPSFFKNSHGGNRSAHKKWVAKLDALAEPVWDALIAKARKAKRGT